ncbi:MAG: phosphate/phosphite/phosphonate ABC transporter substrate-binding protein [Myxococcota bacterium]|nr:phosphate/phosphite/phosphonate ABC transporter substrate-binding protein [Myxococcota bacterium]
MTQLLVAGLVVVGLATPAYAEAFTVGLFAPSAPFPSTPSRVELASRLGEHLAKALGGTASGRVYARAADFAAAVKRGDVTVALVDASYLAHTSGYTVLALSVRSGDTAQGWQLIARGAKQLADLRGKRVLVPANGGRESDFLLNVLLGGIEKDFVKVEAAPDTASALAAISLGKADAAVVPAGVELPAGSSSLLALPAIPTPVLVSYGALSSAQRAAVTSAAASFQGDATVGGFRAGDAEAVRAIARRFTMPAKRGPFVVPSVRLVVGDLVENRKLAIERTPPAAFAIAPAPR